MRILFVVPYTPNLIRTRPFNLIRSLHGRGHQVTLFTVWSGAAERADAAALAAYCRRVIAVPLPRWRSLWNCLAALPTTTPLQSHYCWQPDLARQMNILMDEQGHPAFDVVHVEHLRGARYGLYLQQLAASVKLHLPVVWDSVDCISHLFQQAAVQSSSRFGRWVTRFELGRTRRYEGWLLEQFSRVLVTSRTDQQSMLALSSSDPRKTAVTILPNGVDLDYFKPAAERVREPATLVFSGKMSYHANISMALRLVQGVMPHVWRERPDVKLTIVGKDPPREILALGQHPAISVTGAVEDIRPYLQSATLAVVPMAYGAGIQNKVLEAMACATPVVATPAASLPLTAVANRDLLVASGDAPFAGAILTLLKEPSRQRAIGAAGHDYVTSNHNWHNITANLEEVYHAAIGQTSENDF